MEKMALIQSLLVGFISKAHYEGTTVADLDIQRELLVLYVVG